MEEIWKDIEGFEGIYQISNTGKVVSLFNGNNKELKRLLPRKGHCEVVTVTLRNNWKKKTIVIARTVYETFKNVKLSNKDLIRYKDNNVLNCNLENLYIMSRSELNSKNWEKRKDCLKYDYFGTPITIKEAHLLCKNGVSYNAISKRLREQKWNIYEAIDIPPIKRKEVLK